MTVTAATIIARARLQLIDTTSQPRWTDAELLGYISDAQRTMVAMSPSITAVRLVNSLVAGARQTIPGDGHMLLDVIRNLGSDGLSPGRAIRIINRELLNAFKPAWYAAQQSGTVQNYLYDPKEPTVFYVYPPANGIGQVELLYSQTPVDVAITTDQLDIPDLYQTAVFYYVMFRAHSKDNDFASAPQAGMYFELFNSFMGVGRTSDLGESPNQGLAPADLATRGAAK